MEEHFPCYNVVVSAEIQKNVYVLGGGIYEKRSMRGLAAALVLAMALPVTAFGAETVQVNGYDRRKGEAVQDQLSISNVTGKTTVLERKPMCVRRLRK